MELKKPINFRRMVVVFFAVFLSIYFIHGFKPSAEATHYEKSGDIFIPAIGLSSDVTSLKLENHRLNTPNTIVGSFSQNENTILLIGHVSTIFSKLNDVTIGDAIIFNSVEYTVKDIAILPKNKIKMNELLGASEYRTIILMTCHGEQINQNDFEERLIVTAQAE